MDNVHDLYAVKKQGRKVHSNFETATAKMPNDVIDMHNKANRSRESAY